jgi:ribosome-associated protein
MDTKDTKLGLAQTIAKILDSKKGEDIKILGIKDLTVIAEYFVIVTGTSSTHVRTLADEVEFKLGEQDIKPARSEGYKSSSWIVLDYSDVIVHVFDRNSREFYNLERLWADGENVDITELLSA